MMIKDAILKPEFQGEFTRMEYFKLFLAQIAIFMAGAFVFGFTMALLEGSAAGNLAAVVLGLGLLAGVFWMLYVSVSIHVKRFRNMGITETSTLVIATVGFYIINNVFPLLILVPLFWPSADKKEVAEAE